MSLLIIVPLWIDTSPQGRNHETLELNKLHMAGKAKLTWGPNPKGIERVNSFWKRRLIHLTTKKRFSNLSSCLEVMQRSLGFFLPWLVTHAGLDFNNAAVLGHLCSCKYPWQNSLVHWIWFFVQSLLWSLSSLYRRIKNTCVLCSQGKVSHSIYYCTLK